MIGGIAFSLMVVLVALEPEPVLAQAANPTDFPASVRIASIIVNGLVRVAAIAAGTYVVWLGHNTLIRGIKGEFEFSGQFGRLKGSAPGLLFVLLGSLVIGWALQAKHYGQLGLGQPSEQDRGSEMRNTSVPPAPPAPPPPPS